jgi:hypothetical protein
MTVSKAHTIDIHDPERQKRYLENYERIFGKKGKKKKEVKDNK